MVLNAKLVIVAIETPLLRVRVSKISAGTIPIDIYFEFKLLESISSYMKAGHSLR